MKVNTWGHLVEQNYVFEVLAREGHRVDKVLVLTTKIASTNPKSANAVDSSDALNVHPPSARCRNPRPRPNLATPRQQRGQAGASIGTSTPLGPLVRQRESPVYSHVPCERRTHPQQKVRRRSPSAPTHFADV